MGDGHIFGFTCGFTCGFNFMPDCGRCGGWKREEEFDCDCAQCQECYSWAELRTCQVCHQSKCRLCMNDRDCRFDSRCLNCRLSGHTAHWRKACDDHLSGYECFSCNKHVSKYCEECQQSDCEDHEFPCVCTYKTEFCNICEEKFCASCVGKTERGTMCVACLVKAYNRIKDSI